MILKCYQECWADKTSEFPVLSILGDENGFTIGSPGQDLAGLVDNFVPANGSNGKIKQYSLELSM